MRPQSQGSSMLHLREVHGRGDPKIVDSVECRRC